MTACCLQWLIIDEEVILHGSMNLTEAGAHYNHEVMTLDGIGKSLHSKLIYIYDTIVTQCDYALVTATNVEYQCSHPGLGGTHSLWSAEEDVGLLRLTSITNNWYEIGHQFPNRSRAALKTRFRALVLRTPDVATTFSPREDSLLRAYLSTHQI